MQQEKAFGTVARFGLNLFESSLWQSEIDWNTSMTLYPYTEAVKYKVQAARTADNPSVLHTDVARFDSGAAYQNWNERLLEIWFKRGKRSRSRDRIKKACAQCSCEFEVPYSLQRQKFCSSSCYCISKRKVKRPTKEILEQKITSTSWLAIGREWRNGQRR